MHHVFIHNKPFGYKQRYYTWIGLLKHFMTVSNLFPSTKIITWEEASVVTYNLYKKHIPNASTVNIPMTCAINETNCISVTVMDAGTRAYGIIWHCRCCYTIIHQMPTANLNWVFWILIAPISKYPIRNLNSVIFLQNILWGFNSSGLYFNITWGRRTRKKTPKKPLS